jgi:hypothetical protein
MSSVKGSDTMEWRGGEQPTQNLRRQPKEFRTCFNIGNVLKKTKTAEIFGVELQAIVG